MAGKVIISSVEITAAALLNRNGVRPKSILNDDIFGHRLVLCTFKAIELSLCTGQW